MYKYGCTSISKLCTSMDVQVCPNYVQVWQKWCTSISWILRKTCLDTPSGNLCEARIELYELWNIYKLDELRRALLIPAYRPTLDRSGLFTSHLTVPWHNEKVSLKNLHWLPNSWKPPNWRKHAVLEEKLTRSCGWSKVRMNGWMLIVLWVELTSGGWRGGGGMEIITKCPRNSLQCAPCSRHRPERTWNAVN